MKLNTNELVNFVLDDGNSMAAVMRLYAKVQKVAFINCGLVGDTVVDWSRLNGALVDRFGVKKMHHMKAVSRKMWGNV